MRPVRVLLSVAILYCTHDAFASDRARIIVPDNVITCQDSTGCINQEHFGRVYKVLSSQRITVMVSLSTVGNYTRADVTITNNGSYPLNVLPSDLRIEIFDPKPGFHPSIPPAEVNLPPARAQRHATPQPDPAQIADPKAAAEEAAARLDSEKDLPAGPVAPNQVVRGHVYFERYKPSRKLQTANLVLPIAGEVFEFPYTVQH